MLFSFSEWQACKFSHVFGPIDEIICSGFDILEYFGVLI